MKTIAFRVPKALATLLDTRANALGVSEGICARVLITEALLDQSPVLEVIRKVEERQIRQERYLRILTVALLVDAGKVSVEDAEAFAREIFSEREICGQC